MEKWNHLADKKSVDKTIKALNENGIDAVFVNSLADAKKKVMSLLPRGAEVMTMTSETLRLSGIADEIEKSKDYRTPRKIFAEGKLGDSEKRKLGAGPDYAVGSVHAATEDGKLIIASATGSQLPAYAYGSQKVIWVVGTQKIVKNLDEGMKRIYEYTFPLENERAKKAYGSGSFVSKILVVNKEFQKDRLMVVFVGEVVGF